MADPVLPKWDYLTDLPPKLHENEINTPGEGRGDWGCTPKSANTNICLFGSFRNRVLTETKVRRECSINVFLILSKKMFVLQKLSILGLNQYISSKFGNELVQVRSRDAAGWATKPTTGRLPLSN